MLCHNLSNYFLDVRNVIANFRMVVGIVLQAHM